MTLTVAVFILLLIVFIFANLPWFTERFLFVLEPKKKTSWMRLAEWLLFYFVVGFISLGFEKKVTGQLYEQDWEFYVVGFFLFMVFALPGFIYRYNFLYHQQRWQRQQK